MTPAEHVQAMAGALLAIVTLIRVFVALLQALGTLIDPKPAGHRARRKH